MTLCEHCERATFNGYPPKGSPEWEVGTVYFWCPVHQHHSPFQGACDDFDLGAPKLYDKRGNERKEGGDD